MKIVVTGGAGFVGSHAAEFYANKGHEVVAFDNLSRMKLLKKEGEFNSNWNYLKNIPNISLVKGDVRVLKEITEATQGAEAIIHTAGQTAVTTSVTNPTEDFSVNAIGTFQTLEAARKNDVKSLVFCSTNKVYGDNVNNVPLVEGEKRYSFGGDFTNGIPESYPIDHCKHTPYGTSKLTADLYMQDHSHMYGLRTGVFRMSCMYGTRQLGLEDQGWVAWFAIAALLGKPLTIFGDGKQVRDVLYVSDLVEAYDKFLQSNHKHLVVNMGGGPDNTLSLLEYMEILERITGKTINKSFSDWRPSDQKVFVSDISKAKSLLDWKPTIGPEEGIQKMMGWIEDNKEIMS